MWGGFMDRATAIAANLDKQLNESVGLEVDPSGSTSTKPPSAASTSAVPATSIPEQQTADDEGGGGGDAWNDDFDDDDDDDGEVKKPPSAPTEPELTEESPAPAPEPPAAESPVTTPTPVAASPASAPTASFEDVPASGWDAGDEDLDLTENDGGENDIADPVPSIDTITFKENNSTGMSALEPPVSPSQTKGDATSEPPASPDPPKALPSTPPIGSTRKLTSPGSPSRTKAGAAFASNVFSTFAHRAESLAHQAESFVHRAGQEDAPPKEGKAGVSSIFSAFGGGSSSHSKKEEKPSPTASPESASGWADDGDQLDLENDEADGGGEASAAAVSESSSPAQKPVMVDVSAKKEEVLASPSTSPLVLSETTSAPMIPEPALTEEITEDDPVMVDPPADTMSVETAERVETIPAAKRVSPAPPSENIEDDPRYQQLMKELRLREEQLSNKSMQLTELHGLMEQQEHDLKQKIVDTKEEAKKRILRAKERCETAEAKVKELQSASSSDSASQTQLIQALREEGEKLAHKQSAMEQAVRSAKLECRDLKERVETEQDAKNKALEKIAKLESELKTTKAFLNAARKGESQAGKLEQDLLSARSDAETKAATILSLQQQVKELTAERKELEEELKRARKEAQQEAQQEKKTLRQEHHDTINDLENKLRTTEREAGVREDALRHEVSELRKRWQDAVRRADAVSMDVQSSTAPLLRQLESMERQNRARAANWAELENRLRSELEETVVQNETLSKERSEFKSKFTRLERSMNGQEQELKQSRRIVEDQTAKIMKLEAQLEEMEAQAEKREAEYAKVERLANEGVMRVRSEMTQTVVDSEERYRGQIEKLENDLNVEHEKRSQLEKQVEQMLENAGMIVSPQTQGAIRREAKPKKLREAQGQAEILAGALGFDSDTDDDEDEDGLGHSMDRGEETSRNNSGGMNSFVVLEQLTSSLKAAKSELEALRKNLRESERVRESLVEELGESLSAKEKLPLFEAKVKELTQGNREKELEIQGLREDIADVRDMYRAQLNVLLEEKASQGAPQTNGSSQPTCQDETPDTVQKSD